MKKIVTVRERSVWLYEKENISLFFFCTFREETLRQRRKSKRSITKGSDSNANKRSKKSVTVGKEVFGFMKRQIVFFLFLCVKVSSSQAKKKGKKRKKSPMCCCSLKF